MAKALAEIVKESIAAGLKEIEKKKKTLQDRQADLQVQLTAVNNELLSLDSQLKTAAKDALKELGISFEMSAQAKPGKGGGKRMTKDEAEATKGKIIAEANNEGMR